MDDKYRKKICNFCRKRGYRLQWQKLRFGYERAVLSFSDSKTYTEAQSAVCKLPETHPSWACHFEGQFDGVIYLMYAPDYHALAGKLETERVMNEQWWRKYHDADEQTRRKMASSKSRDA